MGRIPYMREREPTSKSLKSCKVITKRERTSKSLERGREDRERRKEGEIGRDSESIDIDLFL